MVVGRVLSPQDHRHFTARYDRLSNLQVVAFASLRFTYFDIDLTPMLTVQDVAFLSANTSSSVEQARSKARRSLLPNDNRG